MTIAGNLKHWRQVRRLTQPELAEKAEIEQSYLSKLENGRSKPSEAVKERLAQALGIETETLERDPSSNGRLKKGIAISLATLAVLLIGFITGFLANRYEVRAISHDGERIETVWSLAPEGIRVDGIMIGETRDNIDPSTIITGSYSDPGRVPIFATRLLDSGLLGTHLVFVKINDDQFVISVKGKKARPNSSALDPITFDLTDR